MKIGDVVSVKPGARKYHTCPFGRENNNTAKVVTIFGEDSDQVQVDRDLKGYKHWNLRDLVKVKS